MTTHALTAKPRTVFGRKVKALRRSGKIPANIFGAKIPSVSIEIDNKEFLKLFKAAGETSLIELNLVGEKSSRPVLIAGYHKDPVSESLLHVDFHQVDLKQKVKATIPLKLIGESPAVAAGNLVVSLRNEIEVEALPMDLPEHLEIDITKLGEVGDTIHAKDIKVDRTKIKLEIDDEEPVITIQAPAKVEEPVIAPAEGEIAPEIGSDAIPTEGGETPKEGGDKTEPKPETKKE
jgi:large subunit ribosomal protein L25